MAFPGNYNILAAGTKGSSKCLPEPGSKLNQPGYHSMDTGTPVWIILLLPENGFNTRIIAGVVIPHLHHKLKA